MGLPKITGEVFASVLDYCEESKKPKITKFLIGFYTEICKDNPFLAESIAKTMQLIKDCESDKAAMFLLLSIYLVHKQIEVDELDAMYQG